MTRRGRGAGERDLAVLGLLAVIAYVPLLLTARGWVVADTKSYLYLDPDRLLERAASIWDPHIGLGTVTHQNIGYLWPMGPFYWVMEHLAVPDWAAQRLWLGTIIFAAGAGVRFLLRTFGWRGAGVTVAAVTYALSPYLLTLAARLSVILLAFAGLPWLVAFVVRALRRGAWRDPALFALTVATIGSVNATALVLVGVAPLLFVPFAVLVSREVQPRQASAAVARIGVLTVAANLWWIAGLAVQASHGIDVLRYTETADVVASASLAHEVLRGLGYWFFYGGDRLGPWIEPSHQYTQRLGLLSATYLLPTLGLLGAGIGRWRYRAYFVGVLVVGTALAVGAYPWDDPPPFGRAVRSFLLTERGLAMRSLPRAVPLVALALAVLLGSGVVAFARRRPRLSRPVTVALVGLAVVALPTLWLGQAVPENLKRPEHIPAPWIEATRYLDAHDDGTRVLEVPGSDFASYRWGNTVDPISPGLMDRPMVARELIPYGTPPAANLLNALDVRLQEHLFERTALAPLARLLRAGDVLLRSDLQYERYNTPRPRELWRHLRRSPGLGKPVGFGEPVPNIADAIAPLLDELELSFAPDLEHPPPVAVFPVEGRVPIIGAKPTTGPIVLAGDGAGIVDAAGAGLLQGDELLLYSAGLDDAALARAVDDGAVLVLTDSNRRRGERWSLVRFTRGYTEPPGLDPLRRDLTDNRLPMFVEAGDDARTVAVHAGGISANATSYGNPIGFSGEERPSNAVDGDPTTAWRTAAFSAVRGERLLLTLDEPASVDHITLLQPTTGEINRWLTKVRLRFDGGRSIDVDLDRASRVRPGQVVPIPARPFSRLEIEVLDDTAGKRPRYVGLTSVGFAEVRIGDLSLDELIRPPTDLLARLGSASLDHALAVVLTRVRSSATETTRNDEELSIVRLLELPVQRRFGLAGQARLSPRVDDDVLDRWLGVPAVRDGGLGARSSARLPGDRRARARAALDGDPATAWVTELGEQDGEWIEVERARPFAFDHLDLVVLADRHHSVPTRLRISADGHEVATVALPRINDSSTAGATRELRVDLPQRIRANRLRIELAGVREVETTNWYGGRPITMPIGIAELGITGVRARPLAARIDSGCRRDLLGVDAAPVAVRITGSTAAALAGEPLTLRTCGRGALRLSETTEIRAAQGRQTGLDIDRLVLRSAPGGAAAQGRGHLLSGDEAAAAPAVAVHERSSTDLRATVTGAEPGEAFWLVLGQSHTDGWQASIDGDDLGPPTLVDGFANGWRIDPADGTSVVDLRFTPQDRVDLALVISALAVLVCIVLALTGTGRRLPPPARDELPLPLSPFLVRNYDGRLPARRRAQVRAVGLGVLAWFLVHPVLGVGLALVSYRALRDDKMRRWFVLGAPAAMALAGAYVLAWQIRYDIAPGGQWPAEFHRAHPLGWAAVLLLVADTVIDRTWSVPDAR